MKSLFVPLTFVLLTLGVQAQTPVPPRPVPAQGSPAGNLFPSVLQNQMVVAYYGHPRSTRMGILGEQGLEETARLLKATAAEWDGVNGDQTVMPALHLIYATIWPDGNLGFLSDAVVQQYVDFAAAQGMIVVLDHQLGKYDPVDAVRPMLKWLKYPHVHFAIDPEWKTPNPGREIGSIRASDVNGVQQLMQDYLVKENINQKKILIVHQFHYKMITDRDQVRSNFDRIDLIHHIDGFGPPRLKRDVYDGINRGASSMPVKGFKLFLPKSWKSAGYDIPMLTPAQVLALTPRPVYISYQ